LAEPVDRDRVNQRKAALRSGPPPWVVDGVGEIDQVGPKVVPSVFSSCPWGRPRSVSEPLVDRDADCLDLPEDQPGSGEEDAGGSALPQQHAHDRQGWQPDREVLDVIGFIFGRRS
jgi:hypothetical protein